MPALFVGLLAFLFASLSSYSLATEIYMSRDAQGNVIFSDRPSEHSQRHEIKELPSVPAFTPPVESLQPAKVTEPTFSYTSLAIISPTNDFTLTTGHAGNLTVSGLLSPGLRETDTLVLLLNNQVVKQGRQTSFSLENLSRGEHLVQIQVRDSKGKPLLSSNPVTVHVKRASALNRGRN